MTLNAQTQSSSETSKEASTAPVQTLSYDLAVIGAGPGGYICAIRAAQLGLKVVCIDKRPEAGGTCLNIGCIPSKALLHATERLAEAQTTFKKMGINCGDITVDLAQMMADKDRIVSETVKGVSYLFKKNQVTFMVGQAFIEAEGRVRVDQDVILAERIVIATGSTPVALDGVNIDEKRIVTSTGALTLSRVPDRMVVIGAGVIGLELGSVWQRLGAKVTIVEFADHIAPGFDRDVAKQLERSLIKQGIVFRLSTKVTKVAKDEDAFQVSLAPSVDTGTDTKDASTSLACDVVLVATGRRPVTDGLGLEALNLSRDKRGHLIVDENFATSCANVYAIGDVTPGPMLAHKAEEEGYALANHLAGKSHHVRHDLIPGVVYTHPEMAMVGKTEQTLKTEGITYSVGTYPFSANGRARANRETVGLVKVLACEKTDTLLGVHILGPAAGELIAEAALAMNFGASAEDIAMTCHAHPTLSEALKEAATAAFDRPLNL